MKSIKLIKLISTLIIFFATLTLSAQIDNQDPVIKDISTTINHYIEGTSNGQPDRLRKAFHPDFNLYSVNKDNGLKIWEGEDYVSGIKVGKKNNREGRILDIDYENDAATAKVEIKIPGWKIFTDYFLLLKYEGSWKIVHKSYTSRPDEG